MTARLSPRFALWRAGAFFGILAAVGIIVFVPAGLREAGFHVAKAWGLAPWAAPLCLLGALPGAVIADRIRAKRTS